MRLPAFIAMGAGLAGEQLLAQETAETAASTSTNTVPVLTQEAADKAWSFSASTYTYIVPDSQDYAQPTFTADHDGLHLEARYNYEALKTGSAWIGYNVSVGDRLAFEFTPMLGGVFGDTMGIAPGFEGLLSWWKLELSSEGEYVFDTRNSSDSFYYSWSELTLAPLDWFRFGLVAQRTRVYASDRELQRGVLVGFTYHWLEMSAYLFNPDQGNPIYVFAVAFTF